MKKFKHGLILMAVGVSTLWFGQYVRAAGSENAFAREFFNGVTVDTSVWLLAYDEEGRRTDVPIVQLSLSQFKCSHHLRDQIFERAKGNPQLASLLKSKNFSLQIDLNSILDGNASADFQNHYKNNVVSGKDHLYVRARFLDLNGAPDDHNCDLPSAFDEKFPALNPEQIALDKAEKAGEEAQKHMNAASAPGAKVSLQREKDGVRPATYDDSDGTPLGVKPAGHF